MSGDVLRTLRAARDERRAPGVELEGLRTVPGAAVRVAAGVTVLLTALAAGFTSLRGPLAPVADALVLLLAALVVGSPRRGWLGWPLLLVGLRVLLGPALPPWQLAALLLAVHLAVLATALAGRVGRSTRVEVAVPVALLRRAWPVQVAVQAVGLVVDAVGSGAGGAAGGGLPGGGAVWRVAALAAAVAVVLLALPPRRRR